MSDQQMKDIFDRLEAAGALVNSRVIRRAADFVVKLSPDRTPRAGRTFSTDEASRLVELLLWRRWGDLDYDAAKQATWDVTRGRRNLAARRAELIDEASNLREEYERRMWDIADRTSQIDTLLEITENATPGRAFRIEDRIGRIHRARTDTQIVL